MSHFLTSVDVRCCDEFGMLAFLVDRPSLFKSGYKMNSTSRLLAAFLAIVFFAQPLVAEPISIDAGKISGETLSDSTGLQVFRGIPYAAPPVGDLRWRPPAPVAPWDGVRECIGFGNACLQPTSVAVMMGDAIPKMSEDCLYLNVWTTAAQTDKKLPVMVWIHGGGLNSGFAHQKAYDGSPLAMRGVVFVSINYRLGPFGFLSLPELSAESPNDVSGNYGFLDQVAALQWVQKNISAFGGDPSRVTIFGESAGGTSVHMLAASPQAKGLFQRAIAQSSWVTEKNVTNLKESSPFQKSAEALGTAWSKNAVKGADDPSLEQLRRVSDEDIFKASTDFEPTAVVDGHFLPQFSEDIYAAGKQHDVPLMVGTNRNEGTMFMMAFPSNTVEDFRQNIGLAYPVDVDRVAQLYPMTDEAGVKQGLDQFITDAWFLRNSRVMLNGAAKASAPAFQYHFTRQSQRMPAWGAHHGAEIAYVFSAFRDDVKPTDRQLSDAIMSYWVNFATTGNPNGDGLAEWPQYDPAAQQYLELGSEIKVGQKLRADVCDELDAVRADAFATTATP